MREESEKVKRKLLKKKLRKKIESERKRRRKTSQKRKRRYALVPSYVDTNGEEKSYLYVLIVEIVF